MDTYPASRMGCLMPKYSVMGVWMMDIVMLWGQGDGGFAGASEDDIREISP